MCLVPGQKRNEKGLYAIPLEMLEPSWRGMIIAGYG